MPEETVVERRGGLFQREKPVRKVVVALGDNIYTLEDLGRGPLAATRTKVVRGIKLKTESLPPEEWLADLSGEIAARARHNEKAFLPSAACWNHKHPMMNIHLIFNAHLDPVWLWPWQAGVDEAIATCRSACDRMDSHPDLVFTRGEAWVYWQIERTDPALFERIRAHVKTGRWQIINGWWIQPDCNAPSEWGFEKQIEIGATISWTASASSRASATTSTRSATAPPCPAFCGATARTAMS